MHAMRSRPAETPSRVVLVPPVQAFALLGRSRHLDLLRGIHGSHCDRAGGFAALKLLLHTGQFLRQVGELRLSRSLSQLTVITRAWVVLQCCKESRR
jgi:hypothetical protein